MKKKRHDILLHHNFTIREQPVKIELVKNYFSYLLQVIIFNFRRKFFCSVWLDAVMFGVWYSNFIQIMIRPKLPEYTYSFTWINLVVNFLYMQQDIEKNKNVESKCRIIWKMISATTIYLLFTIFFLLNVNLNCFQMWSSDFDLFKLLWLMILKPYRWFQQNKRQQI